MDHIVDMREYDVPYHVRVSIDRKINVVSAVNVSRKKIILTAQWANVCSVSTVTALVKFIGITKIPLFLNLNKHLYAAFFTKRFYMWTNVSAKWAKRFCLCLLCRLTLTKWLCISFSFKHTNLFVNAVSLVINILWISQFRYFLAGYFV